MRLYQAQAMLTRRNQSGQIRHANQLSHDCEIEKTERRLMKVRINELRKKRNEKENGLGVRECQ